MAFFSGTGGTTVAGGGSVAAPSGGGLGGLGAGDLFGIGSSLGQAPFDFAIAKDANTIARNEARANQLTSFQLLGRLLGAFHDFQDPNNFILTQTRATQQNSQQRIDALTAAGREDEIDPTDLDNVASGPIDDFVVQKGSAEARFLPTGALLPGGKLVNQVGGLDPNIVEGRRQLQGLLDQPGFSSADIGRLSEIGNQALGANLGLQQSSSLGELGSQLGGGFGAVGTSQAGTRIQAGLANRQIGRDRRQVGANFLGGLFQQATTVGF